MEETVDLYRDSRQLFRLEQGGGTHFIIITDHRPLVSLLFIKDPSSQIMETLEEDDPNFNIYDNVLYVTRKGGGRKNKIYVPRNMIHPMSCFKDFIGENDHYEPKELQQKDQTEGISPWNPGKVKISIHNEARTKISHKTPAKVNWSMQGYNITDPVEF
ncbi:hypothetical protein JTB14_037909 [Gonioctena quinquepunctata]|nr:hypothetical protein JTB14_037909 [Gonioctena quinquepunctata]